MANLKVPTWGHWIDRLSGIVNNESLEYEEVAKQIVDVLSDMYKVEKPSLDFHRDIHKPSAAAQYCQASLEIEFFSGAYAYKGWFINCVFHEFAHHLQKIIEKITGEPAFPQMTLSHSQRPHEISARAFANKFEKAIRERDRTERDRLRRLRRSEEPKTLTCPICGHKWTLRKGKIKYRRCPKCHKYF